LALCLVTAETGHVPISQFSMSCYATYRDLAWAIGQNLTQRQLPHVTMLADMATDSKPNPYVLSFSIGVGLALAILVSVLRFPWVWDQKYKQLRDFLFFSVGFFIILIRRYWHVRNLLRFWLALLIFAVVHSVGFWLFISRVRDLRPIEFILIIAVEVFPAGFFINWFARVRVSDGGTPERID
jgi:hypothetical protein